MGLKVLKWVYELGVNQERARIASLLQNELSQRRFGLETRRAMYDDLSQKKVSKERLAKLERSIELSQEVSNIIDALFVVQPKNNEYTSLMFPEEEKKL